MTNHDIAKKQCSNADCHCQIASRGNADHVIAVAAENYWIETVITK
jgi:hypothetical protein